MSVTATLTKEEFKESTQQNDKVVLVDFWAEWCAPCRAMAPTLEGIAHKYDGKLDVVKVNIEESQDNNMLANEHGVQGIPNLVVYKNGQVVKNLVGLRSANVLERELKEYLDS